MDDDLSDRLRELGRAVADVGDDEALQRSTDALARVRGAFVAGRVGEPGRGSPNPSGGGHAEPPIWRTKWMAVFVAACLAVSFGSFFITLRLHPPRPISFSVGDEEIPGVVGDWVAASSSETLPTRFSDGSDLDLSPGARMRVTTTNPAGADVLIERGKVHASVAHPRGAGTARWAVRAGPFEVRVTGTTFDAAWDPIAETFELTMIEGRVLVTGPSIPPDRTVVGGERLVVSVRDAQMVLSNVPSPDVAPAPSDVPRAVPEAPPVPSVTPVTMGNPVGVPQTPPGPAPAPAAWKELASKGKYRDAFAAAEAAGFGQEVERAPAGDLMMLADAARFSGSPGRAREALLAARRRFGTKGQSAFLLGKIAADQLGSPGDAVGWFETYLREEPGGPLAEQALGRIVDLTRRSSPEAAQRAASRYLARYPDGSYAALARSLSQQ